MSRQLICTVGTSLLTNRERPWSGWNPRVRDTLPDKGVVEQWLRSADPVQASAETNTLRAIEACDQDALALLHSDTAEGEYCASRLKNMYESRCREVSLERIGRLGYGTQEFTAGLKARIDVTIRVVHDGNKRGRSPVLCATGGFKAEIAFLNLLGALLEIEVVYLFMSCIANSFDFRGFRSHGMQTSSHDTTISSAGSTTSRVQVET